MELLLNGPYAPGVRSGAAARAHKNHSRQSAAQWTFLLWENNESFEAASNKVLQLRNRAFRGAGPLVLPVLVRLTSQPFPAFEQLASLHDKGVPVISVPDRLVRADGDSARDRLRAELQAALENYLNAHHAWARAQRARPTATQKAPEPETGELSDEERQAFLRTMSDCDLYDDSNR